MSNKVQTYSRPTGNAHSLILATPFISSPWHWWWWLDSCFICAKTFS